MPIRGILFDKDGTLLDYHATWMPVNRELALRTARGDADLAERLLVLGGYDRAAGRIGAGTLLAAGNNLQIATAWHGLAGHLWPDFAELLSAVNAGFAELSSRSAQPVTDLAGLVGRLRGRGLKLGIATADSLVGITASLGAFAILDQFDFVCGYDSGYPAKPDPGPVHGFAEAAGIPCAEIMVVGDNLHDLEMGRAAGAGRVVGVLTGTSAHGDLAPHADDVVPNITAIEALLDQAT